MSATPDWVRSQRRAEHKCETCGGPGESTWAGTGELLCWQCIEAKRTQYR